jgi:hypothetical protein
MLFGWKWVWDWVVSRDSTVDSSPQHLVSTWTLSFGRLLRASERWSLIMSRPGGDFLVVSSQPNRVKRPDPVADLASSGRQNDQIQASSGCLGSDWIARSR